MKAILGLVVVLVAASQATTSTGLKPGFKVKFDQAGTPGVDSFFDVPLTIEQAKKEKWVKKEAPKDIPDMYKELDLYCFEKCHLNVFYEKNTGYVGGMMVGLPKKDISKHAHDMKSVGFCDWTVEIDGEKRDYWAIPHFYLADFLCLSPEERIESYDTSKIWQDDCVVLTGLYGELMVVPANEKKMVTETLFKKQAWIPMMGTHYYYNMTKQADQSIPLLSWFIQVDDTTETVIAASFMVLAEMPSESEVRDNFERPTSGVVQVIVPDSPQWMIDLVDQFGILTMHTYFIADLSPLLEPPSTTHST